MNAYIYREREKERVTEREKSSPCVVIVWPLFPLTTVLVISCSSATTACVGLPPSTATTHGDGRGYAMHAAAVFAILEAAVDSWKFSRVFV